MKIFGIGAALGAFGAVMGNFVYQLFQDVPNWASAVERSYFQLLGFAIAVVGGIIAVRRQQF